VLKKDDDSPAILINGVEDPIHILCLLSRKFAIMDVISVPEVQIMVDLVLPVFFGDCGQAAYERKNDVDSIHHARSPTVWSIAKRARRSCGDSKNSRTVGRLVGQARLLTNGGSRSKLASYGALLQGDGPSRREDDLIAYGWAHYFDLGRRLVHVSKSLVCRRHATHLGD